MYYLFSRSYALEKTRHDFRANKDVTDQQQIAALLNKAQENLDMAKRQVLCTFCL